MAAYLPFLQIVAISNHLPCCCIEHTRFTFGMYTHSVQQLRNRTTRISSAYEKATTERTESLFYKKGRRKSHTVKKKERVVE